MFEIKNENALFRLSFIERIEEPSNRRLDLVMCWLEVVDPYINLQCQCELTLFDLESLRDSLSKFYASINSGLRPLPFQFSPRVENFTIECLQVEGGDYVGLNFTIRPHLSDGWTLNGGIALDQSYFPALIQGVESILTN